jgi:hypothetical protein
MPIDQNQEPLREKFCIMDYKTTIRRIYEHRPEANV